MTLSENWPTLGQKGGQLIYYYIKTRRGNPVNKMLSAPFLTPAETKNTGATIRIGQEIWCLPYAGFFTM